MKPHNAVIKDLCRFLDAFEVVDYIADHGAGRRLRGTLGGPRSLAVGGRRPDIHVWINGVSYCVNVTSGSLLKRNRLMAQLKAWDDHGERIICIVSGDDVELLNLALRLIGIPEIASPMTVEMFETFVNTAVKKISSDTPNPVITHDVDR